MKFAETSQEVMVNKCQGELFRNMGGYYTGAINFTTAGILGPPLPTILVGRCSKISLCLTVNCLFSSLMIRTTRKLFPNGSTA